MAYKKSGYKKENVKYESTRAYMADPNVSKLFRPVAEEIIKTAERIGINGMQFNVLKERMEAKKQKEIAEKFNLSKSTIQYYERAAIKKIEKVDPTLVKELRRIMEMPFTDEVKKERRRDYAYRYVSSNREKVRLSSIRYSIKNREKRKRTYMLYYAKNRERLLENARERYRLFAQNKSQGEKYDLDYLKLLKEAKTEVIKDIEIEAKKYEKILKSNKTSIYEKEEAILAIGARQYRKSFKVLLKYLESNVEFIKDAVIWSFGEQSEHRAVPYLLRLIENSDIMFQIKIIRSLANMGNSASLYALNQIKECKIQSRLSPDVRDEVIKALSSFKFRKPYDELKSKIVSVYISKLISNGLLTKENYLKAYELFREANLTISKDHQLYSEVFKPNPAIPIPIIQQRKMRVRFYLSKTSDQKILKTLAILETLRELWGESFNHSRILNALEKNESKNSKISDDKSS